MNRSWMNLLESTIGRWAARVHQRPVVALTLVVLLSAIGFGFSQRLSLNADLSELLPRSFRSVQDLDVLRKRFGGIGYVVVVGRGAEPQTLQKFADDLAPRLEKLPGVKFVEHRRAGDFFADRALLYLDLEDLKEVERRVRTREKWERRQRNPLLIKLDEEQPPPLDFSDIEAKYAGNAEHRLGGGSSYYLDEADRMVVLLVKPDGMSADLKYAAGIVGRVERLLSEQDLRPYGPDLRVELTGTFKKKLDQQKQITADLAASSTAALVLMLLYLLLHFRSAFSVVMVLAPVSVGLVWTYGLVGATFGSVNLLTAFLGAILGGLGTEHGIHLIGRYSALRGEGVSSEDAVREAFTHTGGSALISSAVAALTFLSLAISEFRAFREFGVIAAFGMLLVLAAYLATLPAVLGLLSRFGWQPGSKGAITGERSVLARSLPRLARPLTSVTAAVLCLLALQSRHVAFDYDFRSLEDSHLPSFVLDHKVNRILGYSQTPIVVLTDTELEERAVLRQISERKARLGAASTIDFAGALSDLVPEHQEEKVEILARLARTLGRVDVDALPPKEASRLRQFQKMAGAQPFKREELPSSVRRQFEASTGGFVLAFPGVDTGDGKNVRALASEVRDLTLPDGRPAAASGESMILADILEMVSRESGPVLAAALILAVFALWASLGGLREALICLLPTVVSIVGLLGTMALAGLRFNFINIVAIPVLIGTTVDAGVHLIGRLSETASEHFGAVLAETGRAICGGLLTSAVGFGALCLADHPGLRSLGLVTILGFAINLIVMLVGFPAVLFLMRRRAA